MRTTKNFALATIAAAALALAGCGGGGSGGSVSAVMPDPMPVDTSGLSAGAMVQAGTYMIAAGSSATHGDVTYSCPAGGEDCVVDVMANGMTTSTGGMATAMNSAGYDERVALVAQINALRTQLGLDANADIGDSVTQLQSDLAALQQQVNDAKDAADAAAQKAMTAKGKVIFDVLDPLGDITAGTATDAVIANAAPTVSAKYGGTTGVTTANQGTFVDGLAAGLTDIDATANTAYTSGQAGMPAMLDANNGFSGTMLTWSSSTRADTMVVYTDVAAPSSALFSERYGGGSQSITSAAGQQLNGAQTGVTGAAFDGRTGGLVAHDANAKSATTLTDNDVVKLGGAYKGAMGSYTCTPTPGTTPSTCTSTVNSNGSITFSDANWTFTANTGAMVSVADGRYLQFGWWMRDVIASAAPLDAVAVFFGTQGGTAASSVDALTGKATYEGGAAGKYAWRDRVADTAHGGHFTAKAALTANFDEDGTNASVMSGSISDFRIGDDGMDPNWTVTLSEAPVTDAGAVARAATVMTQWAVGSSKAGKAGGWQAQLYANTGASRNDNLPTGVSGAFDAEFGEQGRMLGAFGANITNANPPN
ncbi:MAG: hypothetical protein OXN81_10400 [Alphaproteobacteria bacterium]|nr:hypothetical protein [Alphaproteobacteria bacterium]